MATNLEELESRLRGHSEYFTSMVELIPAKFYAAKEELEEESSDDGDETENKFWINTKKSRAPKQAVKESTKKAKRLKVDPLSNEKDVKNQEEGVYENGVTVPEDERNSDSDDERTETVSKRRLKDSLKGFSVERVQSGDLNDLRQRLHNKISKLRGKRRFSEHGEGEGEGGVSAKVVTKKQQRVLENRQKKKESRKKDREHKHVVRMNPTKKQTESTTKRPSIKDDSGRVVFSKFDFGTTGGSSLAKGKTKDFKKLLAKAEAAQKRLEEIKETDEKKSKELQEKLQWQRAIEMAKGTKLRDDTKRLKKTVKRLESKKSKSRKQWLERQNQENEAKEKQQVKRKKNIQERIEQVKAKKLKKKRKPRKPGF